MRNREIFEKAIEQAEKNGFDLMKWELWFTENKYSITMDRNKILDRMDPYIYNPFFSHEFCKAFFGKKVWQLSLQQMVLQKEPLQFIKKFLKKDK